MYIMYYKRMDNVAHRVEKSLMCIKVNYEKCVIFSTSVRFPD